ncbi:MAG: YdeI/OmpD-associated family protein [Bryobacterales bacterium]|nr:YdeI/OmpD-associated family protein [Bryobacterales bacterium]
MSRYPYAFEGEIVHHNLGTLRYTVVFLPDKLAAQLPFNSQPRLRVRGLLGDVPFSGAWQPSRGRWYLMLSQRTLRSSGYAVGDHVPVSFEIDDQHRVDTPPVLLRAIQADPDAQTFWDTLTAGKQRAMAHLVASAKTAETREARLERVMDALRHHQTLGPPSKAKGKPAPPAR